MGLTDQTSLHVSDEVACVVHPHVLFSIIDHYSRREENQQRVIGTLLGTVDDAGTVTVCSGFPVPHTETEEQVAVNTDFHATMLQLHRRVFPKQQVVGWYSTGVEVNDSSILFHEFYGQEVERPIHLLLDQGLGESRMSCKAYISAQLSLGDMVLGTVFQDIKLTVDSQVGPAPRVRRILYPTPMLPDRTPVVAHLPIRASRDPARRPRPRLLTRLCPADAAGGPGGD